MRVLEERRREVLAHRLPRTTAMIIPIVLRGPLEDLPIGVPAKEFVEDFTQFDVGTTSIIKHSQFKPRIKLMSERIWDVWRVCENDVGTPSECEAFSLPAPQASDWGPERGGPNQARPL
jgi:hypothetical protein